MTPAACGDSRQDHSARNADAAARNAETRTSPHFYREYMSEAPSLGSERIDLPTASWDAQVDVLVVGTGCAGFAAALAAGEQGAEVLMLEKASEIGGTTNKAGVWIWVPNNSLMRAAGTEDPKHESLRYMARLARPQLFQADCTDFGLPGNEFELIEAFYDSAASTIDALGEMGAFTPIHRPDAPDYYAALPENAAPYGHVMYPRTPEGDYGTGAELIRQLSEAAARMGVRIQTDRRVRVALRDGSGRVVGVRAEREDGSLVSIRARQGVVFATGGFTHNRELLLNSLAGPVFGGAAALSNTGDFIPIATSLGAQLGNMNNAWYGPIALETGLAHPDTVKNIYTVGGDSMVFVNRHGRRVVNEKAPYNELTYAFFHWDPVRAEYPNLLMMMIYDRDSAEQFANPGSGNPIPPQGGDDAHVITGETLAELSDRIRERLQGLGHLTGNFHLSPDFLTNLGDTIGVFNGYARAGQDPEFHRGETPIELFRNGPAREGNPGNPTMFPLAEEGPYHAVIIAGATLDTRGGPRIDAHARVLDVDGDPIPGLYAAGNCVASPSGQGYWGGGATVALGLTFGFIAGSAVVAGGTPNGLS